jgi:hypothetical protein
MSLKVFSGSAQGANHLKETPPKECQDSSVSAVDEQIAIAIVADGHGSENCFRSKLGSGFAVDCAMTGIRTFIRAIEAERKGLALSKEKAALTPAEFAALVPGLVRNIIASWHARVEEDYTRGATGKVHNFTEQELSKVSEKYLKRFAEGDRLYRAYGTTLIACAATEDYWFGIHIGDGKLSALYPDGSFDQPVPWDERCFLNETTSICDEDAAEGARFYYRTRAGVYACGNLTDPKAIETGLSGKEMPVAIFLNSDGVDDSYPAGDNDKHLAGLYRTIAFNFIDDMKAGGGFEKAAEELNAYLGKFSERGSGDDISIAGIVDSEALLALEPILRKQTAAEATAKSEVAAKAESAAKAEAVTKAEAIAKAAAKAAAPSASKPLSASLSPHTGSYRTGVTTDNSGKHVDITIGERDGNNNSGQ